MGATCTSSSATPPALSWCRAITAASYSGGACRRSCRPGLGPPFHRGSGVAAARAVQAKAKWAASRRRSGRRAGGAVGGEQAMGGGKGDAKGCFRRWQAQGRGGVGGWEMDMPYFEAARQAAPYSLDPDLLLARRAKVAEAFVEGSALPLAGAVVVPLPRLQGRAASSSAASASAASASAASASAAARSSSTTTTTSSTADPSQHPSGARTTTTRTTRTRTRAGSGGGTSTWGVLTLGPTGGLDLLHEKDEVEEVEVEQKVVEEEVVVRPGSRAARAACGGGAGHGGRVEAQTHTRRAGATDTGTVSREARRDHVLDELCVVPQVDVAKLEAKLEAARARAESVGSASAAARRSSRAGAAPWDARRGGQQLGEGGGSGGECGRGVDTGADTGADAGADSGAPTLAEMLGRRWTSFTTQLEKAKAAAPGAAAAATAAAATAATAGAAAASGASSSASLAIPAVLSSRRTSGAMPATTSPLAYRVAA